MVRVEVRTSVPSQLSALFCGMREWLDHRRVEAKFSFLARAGIHICIIDFEDSNEAEAFAAQFDGMIYGQSA